MEICFHVKEKYLKKETLNRYLLKYAPQVRKGLIQKKCPRIAIYQIVHLKDVIPPLDVLPAQRGI